MRKYKDLETFVKAMRKDTTKKLWHDCFNIGGHWFAVEEYDEAGRYMRLTSITKGEHIDLSTSNRYSSLWLSDLEAVVYPAESYLFDWQYYITQKELAKLPENQIDQALKNIAKTLA